jgi:hypothetical protein
VNRILRSAACRTSFCLAAALFLSVIQTIHAESTTVHFTIDFTKNTKPISRLIYGVNELTGPMAANATFFRFGGNRSTTYNWTNNASNAGNDYHFQNDDFWPGGNTPGGAVIPTLQAAAEHDAGALITVPINGFVAADKNPPGDVRASGPDYLKTRFRPELPVKGTPLTLTPDPNAPAVYQDEFVNWVKTNYPYGETDPNRPISFMLDNEPALWASTHAEVRPKPLTYAELIQRSIDYADAIKTVEPNALIYGAVNYGWGGMRNLQNAPDANGRDFEEAFLKAMAQAEKDKGRRLIDVLDFHWYPEVVVGKLRITEPDASPAVVEARLQAPRSLWDRTYVESSWVTKSELHGAIYAIPRVMAKIRRNYPGTKLSISEYNYGGGADISGGIAEADVLGIFGREGIFSANEWPQGDKEPFTAGAIQLYRNMDGGGTAFGDTSVFAQTDDFANTSLYASTDSKDPSRAVIIAINKSQKPVSAAFQLNHSGTISSIAVYRLTAVSPEPVSLGDIPVILRSTPAFLPPRSVTAYVLAWTPAGR